MVTKRTFWPVEAVGIKAVGFTGVYTKTHGLQSGGITTNFNPEKIFEKGEVDIYENVEDLPEVEVTLNKVLDGYSPLYLLATENAPTATLVGRQNQQCICAFAIYDEQQDSSSGVPLANVECSGLYVNSINYDFPVDGNFTESVTLVGTEKLWNAGQTSLYGTDFTNANFSYDNTDSPAYKVQRRQHLAYAVTDWGSSGTILPRQIPGITTNGNSGVNTLGSDNCYDVSVQSIRVSADLGREEMRELGTRNICHRFVTFPVDVTTEIEVIAKSGDHIEVTANGVLANGRNTQDEWIRILTEDSLELDLGTSNTLQSVTYGGADAGGGNATITFTYSNSNVLTVTHPDDPSGL